MILRPRRGIPEALLDGGVRAASRVARAVMDDPRGQEAIARAVGAAQAGKRQVEQVQGAVMRAAGLPTKGDYDEIAKGMARVKRKLREISRQIDAERKR